MGCWDVYCIICGNTCWTDGKVTSRSWITHCILLLANNDVLRKCKEVSCNTTFIQEKKTGAYTVQPVDRLFNYFDPVYFTNKGLFIHDACYKFVENTLGLKLKYGDLPIRLPMTSTKYIPQHIDIDYKPISNYWRQFIEYDRMTDDGNEYLASNPLSGNEKNIRRIKKILSLLKLKKEHRKGPTASATFYKNGDIKSGNDGNFWIKRNGKWNIIHDELIKRTYVLKKNHNHAKFINSIPQLGEFNTELLFVKKFSIKNRQTTIEFIGTSQTISKLEKYV